MGNSKILITMGVLHRNTEDTSKNYSIKPSLQYDSVYVIEKIVTCISTILKE